MEEEEGQWRRSELVGGRLIRSLGGLSQVLPLKGNQQRMEYDPRGLGRGDFVAEIIKEAERNIRRHIRVSDRKTFIDNSIQKICGKEHVPCQIKSLIWLIN
jgi:hypothetical protein